MKRLIQAVLACAVFSLPLAAQVVPTGGLYTWPTITATGPSGYVNLKAAGIFTQYNILVAPATALPTTCTFKVEGSVDTVSWVTINNNTPLSCATATTTTITSTSRIYIRVNVMTYTAGSSTGMVFTFNAGQTAATGGGVTSIDTQTGAFTFGGTGVSHVGNAYTFTGGGAGKAIEYVFTAAGSYAYPHALGVLYPVTSCFAKSGSSAYTLVPTDTNHMTVTVAAASDLVCAFVSSGTYVPVATNFAFTVAPASITYQPSLAASQTQNFTLSQTPLAGYTATTTYGVTGLASGMTANAPTIAGGTGTATETITFPWNQTSGASSLTVTGVGGGNTNTQPASLTIGTVNNGLVEGWQLGEASGLAFADVQAVSTITATASAMTIGSVSGLTGTAPIFAGTTGQYAQAANATNTSFITNATPFSISLWVTFAANGTYDMVADQSTGDTSGFYILRSNGNQLQFTLCGSSCNPASINFQSTATTVVGTLYHLVFTYSGSGLGSGVTAYINGSVAPGTLVIDALAGTVASSVLRLGSDKSGASPHHGAISRVHLWNRAITSAEVSALYSGVL